MKSALPDQLFGAGSAIEVVRGAGLSKAQASDGNCVGNSRCTCGDICVPTEKVFGTEVLRTDIH